MIMAMKFRMLGDAELRRFLLIMAIGAYVSAILELFSPREPHTSGRWGWLNSLLYSSFGKYGLAVWWVLVGTALIIGYVRKK
jgi:hypothetical protein